MADPTRDDPTSGADDAGGDDATEQLVERGPVTAEYVETDDERVLTFDRDGRTAAIVQNATGYAIVKVRTAPDGDELERYYGFDMALDHAAERLGVAVADLPVPEAAADMGM
ncbi:DUF7111 family protein [Halopenitus persicus]|uniref:DUF7111 family protein n=1 Tax=Halopenitus persicus TaxID=1048396 RepID=UPI000BBA5700|nr:hypothetical protein [Halopenitus persicus]